MDTMQEVRPGEHASQVVQRRILPRCSADQRRPLSTGIPSPACMRCRQQKLKCDRIRPTCARCRKQNALCSYPSPATRKRQQRRWDRRPFISTDGANGANSGHSPLRSAMSSSQVWIGNRSPSVSALSEHELGPETDAVASCDVLPPRAVGLALLETYFSHIYNAALLFHKPTLFQQYLEDAVPDFLLRSIFALVTLFLAPFRSQSTPVLSDTPELTLLQPYHSCGRAWADAAMKEVFLLASKTQTLAVAQALECLTLYMFATGESNSADLSLALAYRCCSLLAYNKLFARIDQLSALAFEGELQRRCLWACWASCCVACEPKTIVRSAWVEVAGLPLPATITSDYSGYSVGINERMGPDWDSTAQNPVEGPTSEAHHFGLLMKLLGIWAKIQLVSSDDSLDSEESGRNELKTLQRRLLSLYNSNTMLSDPLFADAQMVSERIRSTVLIQALYSLCQMVLHSTFLRFFAPPRENWSMSRSELERSVETIIRHADLVIDLLKTYLARKLTLSKLYPLVGYAASVAGLVLSACAAERCCDDHSNADGRNVQIVISALDGLRAFWKPLELQYDLVRRAATTITPFPEQEAPDTGRNRPQLHIILNRCRLPLQKVRKLCDRLVLAALSSKYVWNGQVNAVVDTSKEVTAMAESYNQRRTAQEPASVGLVPTPNQDLGDYGLTNTNDRFLSIDTAENEENLWDLALSGLSLPDFL